MSRTPRRPRRLRRIDRRLGKLTPRPDMRLDVLWRDLETLLPQVWHRPDALAVLDAHIDKHLLAWLERYHAWYQHRHGMLRSLAIETAGLKTNYQLQLDDARARLQDLEEAVAAIKEWMADTDGAARSRKRFGVSPP